VTEDTATNCPLCGGEATFDVLRIDQVPVYCNVLWPDRSQARGAPLGQLALTFCVECAHLFNAAFDPRLTDYTPDYDNSLHYSARFNDYAKQLADRLIEKYNLHGKRIVEIGCGKGDFLKMLCGNHNRGFGFDRSFEPARMGESTARDVRFFQDFYDADHARRCQPDFICCRHVVEHIQHPLDFLGDLRKTLEERSQVTLYFEVPNALYTLKDMGIWDLIYEHCAYFSLNSLIVAFTRAGFDVMAGDEAFGGQFVWVEARPGTGHSQVSLAPQQAPKQVRRYAEAFADQYRSKVTTWREQLQGMSDSGDRPVVWGAGSKGVTFLNVLKDRETIPFVVDLNPHKQGRYVAGTGQKVVPPEFLREYRPTHVIVMNPLYLDEIAAEVRAMELDSQILSV
jgi:SAM-dependent methyltransferase